MIPKLSLLFLTCPHPDRWLADDYQDLGTGDRRFFLTRSHWRLGADLGSAHHRLDRWLDLVRRARRCDAADARDPLFAAHLATTGKEP